MSLFKTDVSKEEDVKNLIEKVIEKHGKIDVLINNAGFGLFANLVDSKTEDFDAMFAVNVRGLYLCCRYAVKSMIEKQAGINNKYSSSIAGKSAVPSASIYSATKHAVMGLSGSLFMEVRKHNVRVTTICPGSVDTHFFDAPGTILNSSRESILSAEDICRVVLLSCKFPVNATISEIELRPTNPKEIVLNKKENPFTSSIPNPNLRHLNTDFPKSNEEKSVEEKLIKEKWIEEILQLILKSVSIFCRCAAANGSVALFAFIKLNIKILQHRYVTAT
jgi:NADP-dependent 3-hydroxy acid dehydrogenase YdfG